MTSKRESSVQIAYRILRSRKRPMTCRELIAVAMKQHGLVMKGKTPDATLNSNFINERKRRERAGDEQRFVRIAPGTWGLVEHVGIYYEIEAR